MQVWLFWFKNITAWKSLYIGCPTCLFKHIFACLCTLFMIRHQCACPKKTEWKWKADNKSNIPWCTHTWWSEAQKEDLLWLMPIVFIFFWFKILQKKPTSVSPMILGGRPTLPTTLLAPLEVKLIVFSILRQFTALKNNNKLNSRMWYLIYTTACHFCLYMVARLQISALWTTHCGVPHSRSLLYGNETAHATSDRTEDARVLSYIMHSLQQPQHR